MRLAVPGRVHHHCGYSYLDARGDAELRWAHQRRFGHAVGIVLLQRQPRSAVGARAPRRHEDQGLAALVAPDASRLLTSGSPASSRTLMAPMYTVQRIGPGMRLAVAQISPLTWPYAATWTTAVITSPGNSSHVLCRG